MESVFLVYLHFFIFLRDRYHPRTGFVYGSIEKRFFTASVLISKAQDSVWKICPYLSWLSSCETFLLFLIQRDGSREVVFVKFSSTSRADRHWEVQGCMKAASVLWAQRTKKKKKSEWKPSVQVAQFFLKHKQKSLMKKFGAWSWREGFLRTSGICLQLPSSWLRSLPIACQWPWGCPLGDEGEVVNTPEKAKPADKKKKKRTI